MDKILMDNMCFYGYHGVMPEEKTLGQKFILDACLYLPLQKAGVSDDLNDTVNYAAVYSLIEHIVTKEQFNLLEALGERITSDIFAANPLVAKIILRIKKPEAPINGIYDYVGIEIERDRV